MNRASIPLSCPTTKLPVPDRSAAPPAAWWLWPQKLCIDAPIVIMCWAAAFAHVHHMRLGAPAYVALGLASWIIYVIDRVSDSRTLPPPLNARHRFCRQHQKVLLRVLVPIAAMVVLLLAGFYLPMLVLHHAFTVGVLASFYLLLYAVPTGGWLHRVMLAVAFSCLLWMTMSLHPDRGTGGFLVRGGLFASLLWVLIALNQPSVVKRWRTLTPKSVPAAFLIALGCMVPVQAWSIGEHLMLGSEVWLFWGLLMANLHFICAAEATETQHSTRADLIVMVCMLAFVWVLSLWVKLHVLHPGTQALAIAASVSAALLLALVFVARGRARAETLHVLADLALIVPLPLLFVLAR
jgi:hypothetical protein